MIQHPGDSTAGPAKFWRPTKGQIAAAVNRTLPDVIAPGLRVLFCGINPGLYTAAVGHHFARPGNRFWPALRLGGLTERVVSPFEEQELLKVGLGITNLVARATARADELTPDELRAGAAVLERKVKKWRPAWLAIVGVTAYRVAFDDKRAGLGEQPRGIGGTRVWVLPNPSGLNAHHSQGDLGRLFGQLRERAFA